MSLIIKLNSIIFEIEIFWNFSINHIYNVIFPTNVTTASITNIIKFGQEINMKNRKELNNGINSKDLINIIRLK